VMAAGWKLLSRERALVAITAVRRAVGAHVGLTLNLTEYGFADAAAGRLALTRAPTVRALACRLRCAGRRRGGPPRPVPVTLSVEYLSTEYHLSTRAVVRRVCGHPVLTCGVRALGHRDHSPCEDLPSAERC
jgi:hypothetical protein